MVGITAVAIIVGISLVQSAAIEAEEDLHDKFSKLGAKFTVLEHRLQEENEKWTQRIQQEEEKVSGLQKQVELLKRQLENVTNMPLEKSSHFEDAIGKFKWHGRHEMLTPNRRQSRSSDPDEVAFTAELTHELNNVPIHSTVRFDHLIYWTGNSYDSSTGVFTCPTSGLYLFAVFIETHSVNTEAVVQLMKDGKAYMNVVSERSDAGEDDTGGNVVLLTVNKGQRIWVETTINDNQSFFSNFYNL